MITAKDWPWIRGDYYTSGSALEAYPNLLQIDPRLPALLLQVQSAEALIDKIMKEALDKCD